MSIFIGPEIFEVFARSGGGGSSSSGSGGGGGAEFLALIGYVPSYYLGKLIKKLLPRKAELIVSAAFAGVFSLIIFVIGVNAGFFGGYVAICIIVGIWIGWSAAFFGITERLKKHAKKAREDLKKAEASDSAWNEQHLIEHAKSVYMTYQQDWANGNYQNIGTYATQHYAYHAGLMLAALKQLGRRNQLENIQINGAYIIAIDDQVDNSKDSFTIAFEGKMKDSIIDTRTNQTLFSDNSSFVEYWTFLRDQNDWKLSRIDQQTASRAMQLSSLEAFAYENHMYYSLDMGWLFSPNSGAFFGKNVFGTTDINNHVIGTYHGTLVQFYTFSRNGENNQKNFQNLVAQVMLPKSYGGIIVRPKKGFFSMSIGNSGIPKSYQKYTFEWPDFNNRYEVFATHADRLATFELLNPGFMQYLYDTDPKATIEVSDNTVYVYKSVSSISAADYQTFLNIMLRAFKELKL